VVNPRRKIFVEDPLAKRERQLREAAFNDVRKRAYLCLQKQDVRSAVLLLEEAGAIDSSRLDYQLLGDIYLADGGLSASIAAYRRAIFPNTVKSELVARHTLVPQVSGASAQREATSNPYWEESWPEQPSADAHVLARYALALCDDGRFAEALRAYRAGLRRIGPPDDPSPDDATWRRVLDIRMSPENFEPRLFKAACYAMIGHTVSVFAWFDTKARVFHEGEVGLAAIAAGERAIECQRTFAPAYLVLGEGHRTADLFNPAPHHVPAAREAFKKALEYARNENVRELANKGL
jgi:tetratricopeptide (TPR) repeat protein